MIDAITALAQGNGLVYLIVAATTVCGLWEAQSAFRRDTQSAGRRWRTNLMLSAVCAVLLTLTGSISALHWAAYFAELGLGLLNQWAPDPWAQAPWAQALLGWALLDLTGYLTHRLMHRWRPLWRIHAIHHSDADFDTATAFRFHPLEAFVSLGVKLAAIAVFGISPLGVAIEAVFNAVHNSFSHANARLPDRLGKVLRGFLITNDLHRLHHSIDVRESQRNFGIHFSLWDRLLGSFQEDPAMGQAAMLVGLDDIPGDTGALALIALPFHGFKSQRYVRPTSDGTDLNRST